MDKHVGVSNEPSREAVEQRREPLANTEKPFWQRIWPIIGCGAGLFSDGYLNGVIGSVSTILATVYPDQYKNSAAQSNVSSITFVGTLIGGLIFGWASDHWSRKWSLVVSTIIIIFFAILCTGSYGANGSVQGLFAALTAYRFFLGIGIGGEYPAGSVACAESTGELKTGTRNRWFIMFTNVQIDFGFVVAALVPMIVVLITTEQHLHTAWRVCLGIGIIPPCTILYLRLKLSEPESFRRGTMANTKTPWWLCIKYYWFRLAVISMIWLLYNFSSYSFGLLSSQLLSNLLGDDSRLWVSFGWNTLLTFWYMPGCIAGSWLSDWVGPRNALGYSVLVQAVVGFIMAGCYKYLAVPQNVAGFVIVYGIFIALGELGPGDNIGLIASKTSATAVRGKYYGIAAAFGKIGAFIGSKTLILLYNKYYNAGETIKAGQVPFLISSVFCLVNAALALFLLPHIGQDTIEEEDARLKAYLEAEGYDVSRMGLASGESSERVVQVEKEAGKGLA
ncbi:glycerophosphoinositol permease [Friedmanniomyces endolithicus]|uniref:Glycerophosphoinositol permease n=1 Tax=Friedmanniomyces endolithicus TaxID=329885 RepID=A0AAN6G0Z8_9PEZI|nr:glycerophosphoinositol permease [Friedmanniomyces endolithicus]KAK0286871.1 glycerophosphoinositol permease [Friedmanniomyces endolithicus]KAK0326573.1 glycerophosphoinositol permease [Friedmanniomyces endolithicus]KAK1017524.1 glycerophosphoinositol permease [Friedmanniomyces endolithicus]